MEDAATAEISRCQVWQWRRNRVVLDTGRRVTAEMIIRHCWTRPPRRLADTWAETTRRAGTAGRRPEPAVRPVHRGPVRRLPHRPGLRAAALTAGRAVVARRDLDGHCRGHRTRRCQTPDLHAAMYPGAARTRPCTTVYVPVPDCDGSTGFAGARGLAAVAMDDAGGPPDCSTPGSTWPATRAGRRERLRQVHAGGARIGHGVRHRPRDGSGPPGRGTRRRETESRTLAAICVLTRGLRIRIPVGDSSSARADACSAFSCPIWTDHPGSCHPSRRSPRDVAR